MPRRDPLQPTLKAIVENLLDEVVPGLTEVVRQATAAEVAARMAVSAGGRLYKKHILPCIAPGCTKLSRGPRYHYLCEDHKHAPRKDWEAWRKQRREKARRSRA